MASPATALLGSAFSRKFDLDPSILPDGASSSITVNLSTGADVIQALAKNDPFPVRPEGVIPLSGISFSLDSGKDLKVKAGQTNVGFSFSASASAGAGIYDTAAKALAALELEEPPGIKLNVQDAAGTRLALVRMSYAADGKVSGSHPVGTFGSVTFGVQGASSGLFAILRRFDSNEGAATVMKDTVSSLRLPRHVGLDANGKVNISPGCWLIAEVDGSLALKVGAQLGYNFSFIHETKIGGLTGDLGLKIDAGLKATFGFDVSGKFIAIVGREETDSRVRLQLFKQKTRGMEFGLNLKVGVTGVAEIPEEADDFIQAVFGVHGAQVAKALKAIDRWTSKTESVGELVAGLANDRALALIKDVTGVDPATKFDQARNKLLDVLDNWDALPGKASARLWKLLNQAGGPQFDTFVKALEALADPAKTEEKLKDLIARTAAAHNIAGEWLDSLTDLGVLALVDRLDLVRNAAQRTLAALNGDILKKLKDQLDAALNLQQIRKKITATDFKKLDSFLVGRLALFLDSKLDLEKLDGLREAINSIVSKRQEIFAKARKALNSTYTFELAAGFRRATSSQALVDAEFDLAKKEALDLFTAVMQDSALDSLFVTPAKGVTLREAVMSHGISRSSFIELNMPMFSFRKDHQNNSLATVRAQDLAVAEEGGRVLVFEVNSKDIVTVRNRYRSSLSMALSANVNPGTGIRGDSSSSATWSYRLLRSQPKMKREALMDFTRPFVEEYMPGSFSSGDVDFSTYFTMFDAAVEEKLRNGKNEFGDVLTSMDVTIPGRALGGWLAPMSKDQRKAAKMRISRAIQSGLKRLLPFHFFQRLDRLRQNSSTAALLVWSSIPATTSVDFRNGRIIALNQDNDVYWNFPDPDLQDAIAVHPETVAKLANRMADMRLRLLEAGENSEAGFFVPGQVGSFISLVTRSTNPFFNSLLFFEAQVVAKAAEALGDLADVDAATKPSEAIKRLAEFGSDITEAFNHKLDSIYADKSALRALGQMVFLEASKAVDPSLAPLVPRAMLTMTVLQNGHQFDMPKFLEGELPSAGQIALEQRLISAM